MRNLFGSIKVRPGRGAFVLLTCFALFVGVFSCKHDKGKNKPDVPKPDATEVLITVTYDGNVASVENQNFKAKKAEKFGLKELNQKIGKVEYKDSYEFKEMRLKDATGTKITESSKLQFNENATIFIASQVRQEKPVLTSLRVGGKDMEIKPETRLEETLDNRIAVEFTHSPSDATVEVKPALKNGKWELENYGENTLKIKIKKGSDSAEYTLKVVKHNTELLKSLQIGHETKRSEDIDGVKAGIDAEMEFAVPLSAKEVDVKVEVGDGVTFEWKTITSNVPDIKDNKLKFVETEKVKNQNQLTPEYELQLTQGGNVSTYKVRVIKMVTDPFVLTSQRLGKYSISKNDVQKILQHEKNLEFTLDGPYLVLNFYSQTFKWKSFVVSVNDENDEECKAEHKQYGVGKKTLFFNKGETKNITIKIENNDVETKNEDGKNRIVPVSGNLAREEFKFKVTRSNETADCPSFGLGVKGADVSKGRADIFESLCSEENAPEFFVGDTCGVQVEVPQKEVKGVSIDGTDVTLNQPPDKNWLIADTTIRGIKAKGSKDVKVVLKPKNTKDFHETTWYFKLVYIEGNPMPVEYEINRMDEPLPGAFKEAVEEGKKPLINVHGNSLNLTISSQIEINSVKVGDVVVPKAQIEKVTEKTFLGDGKVSYVAMPSVLLKAGENKVKVEVNPKDMDEYSTKVLEFRVKSDGKKEVMKPVLKEIAGETNISQAFANKMQSGTDVPVHTINKGSATAKIVLNLSPYDRKFLCDKVKVDGKNVEIKKDKESSGFVAEAEVAGITGTDKVVNVEFVGKTGLAENVNWKFKLNNGGDLPKLPKETVAVFSINGQGGAKDPLPKDFRAHLTDGTFPVFEFYGTKALVRFVLGIGGDAWIGDAEFKLDGAVKAKHPFKLDTGLVSAEYEFEIPDATTEHKVEVKLFSKKSEYSALVYSFKLKSLDTRPALKCVFGLNYDLKPSGYRAVLKRETVQLQVQIAGDVMKTVEMGEEGKLVNCAIESLNLGKTEIFQAFGTVSLDANSEKTYIIKVTPKDDANAVTICKYILKGTKIEDNNAEFEFGPQNNPIVSALVTQWGPGVPTGSEPDLFGAEKADVTARTLSPGAKVKYKFVDALTLQDIAGQTESTMTDKGKGLHVAEGVRLFNDKPTKMKAWVVAKDGKTTDEVRGVWYFTFNPMPLWWGYGNTQSLGDFRTKGYNVITIDKSKVKKGKIYIMIAPWAKYSIDNEGLPEGQSKFVDKGKLGSYQKMYWTSVDVSGLVNGTMQERDVLIKVKDDNETPCFTYRLKVKAK